MVGSLIHLTITRLDISFAVHTVSKFMQSPRHFHLSVVHQILRYLLDTFHRGLFFPTGSPMTLQAYSDADWARCPIRGDLLLVGVCFWAMLPFKKQDFVSKSSTEAKYRAMFAACSEIIWLRDLLTELGFSPSQPTP